jgi:ATPase complex subunit ATP10
MARLLEWGLRRGKSVLEQERYLTTGGLSLEVKDYLAILNGSVGYVFLVDEECRIRWSACADASEEEKVTLVKGVKSLIRA